MKIFHITSVHPRYDTRIFLKECSSLAGAGYDVSLIVCDGYGDEEKNNVKIIDAGNCHNLKRIKRMINGPDFIDKVLKNKIENYSNTIIHFHDPELLFLGKKYAKKGCKVIYDSHENVPGQILSKPYIKPVFRKIISNIIGMLEAECVSKLSSVISVTDDNTTRLQKYNNNAYLVRNFPILSMFDSVDFEQKKECFLYAGGITAIRGVREIAEAAFNTKTNVNFYGPCESDDLKKQIENEYTQLAGNIKQNELYKINMKSTVGFILFYKVPNHMVCSPNKLFEYMASGMAVIASDIPMWKEIIEKYQCGICVDPTDVDQICDAMKFMKNNPDKVREMGENGRKSVFEHFSWENESKVLLECYKNWISANYTAR